MTAIAEDLRGFDLQNSSFAIGESQATNPIISPLFVYLLRP
jgi:hypothetical protein